MTNIEDTITAEAWNRLAVLGRLETALGLYRPRLLHAERVVRCAAAAEEVKDLRCRESLAADRWATAELLLRRRDAAMLAGWDGHASKGMPDCLKDLAAIGKRLLARHASGFDSEAERLHAVGARLASGLKWPGAPFLLADPPDSWPGMWQSLWRQVPETAAPEPGPSAPAATSLARVQTTVGKSVQPVGLDPSLTVVRSRSRQAATQAVAAMLGAEPKHLCDTVVLAGDAALAVGLDFHLRRLGLPAGGARPAATTSAAEQLLPLVLGLCWEPADPGLLIDLLTLPVGPVPRRCGYRLADALGRMPGLHSQAWDDALAELLTPDNDREPRVS